jgi:hypothetical protein
MSKVKYHKHAIKHTGAKQVKRMLTKLISECPNVSFYFDVTGIEKNEEWNLKYYHDLEIHKLHKFIGEEIESDKEYKQGFSISQYEEKLKFIRAMHTILNFVRDEYYHYEMPFVETPIGETLGG